MDITRFLDKPNTPVPIPRDASLMQEKCIIAGNLAMQELSVKKKERQRVTLQPRIKWTAQERFVPACTWVVYGEEYVSNTAKSINLNWRFGNHFEVVNKM